jgi:hypothetical protein
MQGCIVEHGDGGGLRLLGATGCSVAGSLLENIGTNAAIEASYISGLSITGNYFEANAKDLSLPGGAPGTGIALIGNYLFSDATISWPSITTGAVSMGNTGRGNPVHTFVGNADVMVKDTRLVPDGSGGWMVGTGVTNLAEESSTNFTGRTRFPGGIDGPIVTESLVANLNAGATVDSTLTIADGQVYQVTIAINDGANSVDSCGQWIVARKGTGTRVEAVKAPSWFTCTVASYKIRITNGDTNTRLSKVGIVRVA